MFVDSVMGERFLKYWLQDLWGLATEWGRVGISGDVPSAPPLHIEGTINK